MHAHAVGHVAGPIGPIYEPVSNIGGKRVIKKTRFLKSSDLVAPAVAPGMPGNCRARREDRATTYTEYSLRRIKHRAAKRIVHAAAKRVVHTATRGVACCVFPAPWLWYALWWQNGTFGRIEREAPSAWARLMAQQEIIMMKSRVCCQRIGRSVRLTGDRVRKLDRLFQLMQAPERDVQHGVNRFGFWKRPRLTLALPLY